MKNNLLQKGGVGCPFLFYQCNHSPRVEIVKINSPTLGYILQGSLVVIDNHNLIRIVEQELYLLRRGTYCVQYMGRGKEPFSEIRVGLGGDSVAAVLRSLSYAVCSPSPKLPNGVKSKGLCLHEQATPLIGGYFAGLTHKGTLSLMGDSPIYQQIKLRELLLLLFATPKSVVAAAIRQCAHSSAQTSVERVVEQNWAENLTIEQLARMCDMKLSTFRSTFRQLFGDSPHHWIMRRRLEKAEELVRNSNAPIKYICYECGFGSPSQMIRHFRGAYGTTPTNYRNLCSAQIGGIEIGEAEKEAVFCDVGVGGED